MTFRDRYRHIKGWLGVKVYGLALNIDIQDGNCAVNCPSCAVGSVGRRRRAKMSLETFKAILDKVGRESKVRNVQLYAYSDPSMVDDIHLYVQECTDRKIPSIFSTVLQHPRCDFAKLVEARPREIRISFPGWKKMHYYQKGARPEEFNKNFDALMTLPRHKETEWTLGFHLYNDNGDELETVKALAERHSLKLVVLPAIFMENSMIIGANYSEQDRELISHLRESPEEEVKRYPSSGFCFCQSKQLTLSATGMTYLCQLTYNLGPLGSFLDSDVKSVRKTMKDHPFCVKCKAAKMNVYQQKYEYFFDPGDPVERAEKQRIK